MKILIANINDLQPIPPPKDLIRADTSISVPLALELKKRGHNVFFLCPKHSKIKTKKIFTSAKPFRSIITNEELYSISNQSLRTEMILSLQFDLYLHLIKACEKERFDLVHLHTNNPLGELIVSKRIKTPFLFTLHGVCLYPKLESRLKKLFKKKNNYFVSISNYQRKSYPGIKFLKTIYNGLTLKDFPFSKKGGSKMFFSGRLKRTKGVKEAVNIALKTGKKLKIVGALSMDPADRSYFIEDIMPIIKNKKNILSYSGFVKKNKMSKFYGKSKLTLFPIQWEEPFGLVMIESMATGTPVVAFAKGSVPEVIKDGETGFIVNSSSNDIRGNWIIKKTGIDGMVEAVKKIYNMPEKNYLEMRKNCQKHVKKKFTIERMINEYEKVYRKILKAK